MEFETNPMRRLRPTKAHIIATLLLGFTFYNSYNIIEYVIKEMEFYFIKVENGFINKREGLNLRFAYEENKKGNLETYLRDYTERFPVFERKNGIMVGTPEYNFHNFTSEERKNLCLGNK